MMAWPGAGGEGHGQGWYLHLLWGDRADIFSTCGQRGGLEESSSWGDLVSGPAPADTVDMKHERAGNSKASIVLLLVPRTARGLAGSSAQENREAGGRWDPVWG